MLVWNFFFHIPFHTTASRPERISSVEDMEDDVGRVDDFVELVPYTLALPFGEDGFSSHGRHVLGFVVVSGDRIGGPDTSGIRMMTLFGSVLIGIVGLVGLAHQVFQAADADLDSFPLRLGSEGVGEGSRVDGHLGPMLLEAILARSISNQAHGDLVGFEQHLIWVCRPFGHGLSEGVQGILSDDASVAEPFPVRFDPGRAHLS